MSEEPIRAAVVTVSDSVSGGQVEDRSGPAARALLEGEGWNVEVHRVVPDEREDIARTLEELTALGLDLVVTTGGTGLAPRDVTPEATADVLHKNAPGLAELMRSSGMQHTPVAALSRGLVGSRDATLIVNLPGSPRGVEESLTSILELVPHAVRLLHGRTSHHSPGRKP